MFFEPVSAISEQTESDFDYSMQADTSTLLWILALYYLHWFLILHFGFYRDPFRFISVFVYFFFFLTFFVFFLLFSPPTIFSLFFLFIFLFPSLFFSLTTSFLSLLLFCSVFSDVLLRSFLFVYVLSWLPTIFYFFFNIFNVAIIVLGKVSRAVCRGLIYSFKFIVVFLLLCFPTKARETGLPYYLTYSWAQRKGVYSCISRVY